MSQPITPELSNLTRQGLTKQGYRAFRLRTSMSPKANQEFVYDYSPKKKKIAKCEVTQVFVDTGHSLNVIFFSTFDQLKVNMDLLCDNIEPLISFEDILVHPIGETNLTLSIGGHPRRASLTTRFTILDYSSTYNVNFGQPFLIKMENDQRQLGVSKSVLCVSSKSEDQGVDQGIHTNAWTVTCTRS
ncbi:hypothetical protein DVH24_005929 [Malus domestica]|uniref:Uncharacterized protein n=1 Tax=Malus domestica TaxID=3750 RepID=A0A498IJZ4_MALDO|nr:hypothetical protein DVH24_005929 [Malus domestica]